MNHGKLDMIKKEMARIKIGILAINWTGNSDIQLDELMVSYSRNDNIRRNGGAPITSKEIIK